MKFRLLPLTIAAAAALTAGAASAQTTQKADGQWRGSLCAGASVTSGNTRSTSANRGCAALPTPAPAWMRRRWPDTAAMPLSAPSALDTAAPACSDRFCTATT